MIFFFKAAWNFWDFQAIRMLPEQVMLEALGCDEISTHI